MGKEALKPLCPANLVHDVPSVSVAISCHGLMGRETDNHFHQCHYFLNRSTVGYFNELNFIVNDRVRRSH